MEGLQAEEYLRLCTEIDNNGIRVSNILAIAFTAFSAIFVFGIDKENEFMILASVIPLIPTFIMIAAQFNSTNRNSTYIRKFYEGGKTKIYWEERLAVLRAEYGYKSIYHRAIKMILLIMGIAALVFSLIYFIKGILSQKDNLPDYFNIIVYSFFAAFIIWGYIKGYSEICKAEKNFTYYINHWNKQNQQQNLNKTNKILNIPKRKHLRRRNG